MKKIDKAVIKPDDTLSILSQLEINRLVKSKDHASYEVLRQCVLAVLNTDSEIDNAKAVLDTFKDFDIEMVNQEEGIEVHLYNAPEHAFVDGIMIRGIQENLFAVIRDMVFITNELAQNSDFSLDETDNSTDTVFHIARNTGLFSHANLVNLAVCWGGHAISHEQYDYTKKVGFELGIRGIDICTGCGPGSMKGPMKGAAWGHANQRRQGRYIGISQPGIIAAESPNPIVNHLIIMPDIEKRLELFVRIAHGLIVFPGGVGTIEEILYLIGILSHPKNSDVSLPIILTGPASSASYFSELNQFLVDVLGEEVTSYYEIILDSPKEVAQKMNQRMKEVKQYRILNNEAYYYNWRLYVDEAYKKPFIPSHESMIKLNLNRDQPIDTLTTNLRKAFSGIVYGNINALGVEQVAKNGPYELKGDKSVIDSLDRLLLTFIKQKRMKINDEDYQPCFKFIAN